MKLQRDVFLEEIYKYLKLHKDLYVISADFGAAALDNIRSDFNNNFIHCGISEQAMFDIATGLALDGKKVITYAMGPFISLRAIEQIKCGPAMMKLPMTILSVGIGLGYADAGPTHYATEDFACLRAIGGTTIITISDNFLAKKIPEYILNNNSLNYVRLDRHPTNDLNFSNNVNDINEGYRIMGDFGKKELAIISHGRILHNCIKAYENFKEKCFLVDLFISKPISKKLIDQLKNVKKILVVDEQTPHGNLSGAIQEELSRNSINNTVITACLPEDYVFENGGRDYLLKSFLLDEESILSLVKKIL